MSNNEVKSEVEHYGSRKWYQSYRGKAAIALSLVFLVSFWYRPPLAIFIFPFIFLVYKGSKASMIFAGVYSGILSVVNMMVYVANNYDAQGEFHASATPLLVYLVLYVATFICLRNAYKVEKLRSSR